MSTKIWRASDAKVQFADLIKAAADGEPQRIRSEDGSDVVLISKTHFDQIAPSLKITLLTGERPGLAGDALDDEIKGSQ
ncbi:MAG: type II toxin-antitoxin system prevent-host-death family antitoxin [Ferrovibrio sp.]|uniref:type II toxin-antitoxin system prevent-host-death family antitoxin n=1 Tax=Ferrovibrio sp. TaxID=1917215 RepID=UPI00263586BE|nr:type II toxin-antitoxin system prevent-host-death family antitoxin [Ferrovibrio sp.]MCW0234739.1 type II toxin-antitoxin system prevent-host-death family antitoxin [Ferrovibrio sp.]